MKPPAPRLLQNTPNASPAFKGVIEPHASALTIPPDDQLLYKVMTVENLLSSVGGNYLHFNRVDSYCDIQNADTKDGQQLPTDQPANAAVKFEKSPEFTLADFYDWSRARTYASCLSTLNSDYIWNNYGNGSAKGKVCVVFEFGKLRTMLNNALRHETMRMFYGENECTQIFSLNYGLIDYVDWDSHRTNESTFPNPIAYTYLKDNSCFSAEKEFRISLSTVGIGQFRLKDGSVINFPPFLQLGFDFDAANSNATIREILFISDAAEVNFKQGLSKIYSDK